MSARYNTVVATCLSWAYKQDYWFL